MTTHQRDLPSEIPDEEPGSGSNRGLSANLMAYRSGCQAYAQAVTAAHRARTEAEERYRDEVERAREAARRAVARRDTASRNAERAAKLVAETDDAAAEIWRKLASFTDRRKLGLTPAPDLDTTPRSASEIQSLLVSVRKTIGRAQQGDLPLAPPPHVVAISMAIGAVGGMIGSWGGGMLLAAGQSGSDGAAAAFHALALVVIFIGLFAGVPVVAGWLVVRHRLGPKPVHLLASVAGAVVGLCALAPITLMG